MKILSDIVLSDKVDYKYITQLISLLNILQGCILPHCELHLEG